MFWSGHNLGGFAHHPDEALAVVVEFSLADHAHLLVEALGARLRADADHARAERGRLPGQVRPPVQCDFDRRTSSSRNGSSSGRAGRIEMPSMSRAWHSLVVVSPGFPSYGITHLASKGADQSPRYLRATASWTHRRGTRRAGRMPEGRSGSRRKMSTVDHV